MLNNKFKYVCIDCDAEYDAEGTLYLCSSCSAENKAGSPPKGVLKVLYDYVDVRRKVEDFIQLQTNLFLDLLPLESFDHYPQLKIGNTPLYQLYKLARKPLNYNLYLKDDSQNPTFSFKDRASALVSAYAKEKGFDTIVAASTGNAGSSIAGICAAQGQKAVVLVPEKAPVAKLTQIVMYGAGIIPVLGTYDEAFDMSVKATETFGWYNRNTAFNPLTVEGKKTVAFELFGQLNYQVPDHIFVPVGDGVIISGVYKGFEDLLNTGMTDKMPCVVGVQSSGSASMLRNLSSDIFTVESGTTIADSISVDIPRNFYMTRNYIREYKGKIIAVSDEEILHAASVLAAEAGIFTEPASAAAFAGLLLMNRQGQIDEGSENVVLLTGSGLKDLKAFSNLLQMPDSIDPGPDAMDRIAKLY